MFRKQVHAGSIEDSVCGYIVLVLFLPVGLMNKVTDVSCKRML